MLRIHITQEVRDQIVSLLGDAALAAWWIEEYERRAREELAEAIQEMEWVSKINYNAQHRPIDGLGQLTVAMGPKLEAWLAAYCPGYQYDESFIKRLMRDNQHLCFKPTVAKKPAIIMPGLNFATSAQPAAPGSAS